MFPAVSARHHTTAFLNSAGGLPGATREAVPRARFIPPCSHSSVLKGDSKVVVGASSACSLKQPRPTGVRPCTYLTSGHSSRLAHEIHTVRIHHCATHPRRARCTRDAACTPCSGGLIHSPGRRHDGPTTMLHLLHGAFTTCTSVRGILPICVPVTTRTPPPPPPS